MPDLMRRSEEDVLRMPAHPILIILDDVRSMHNVGSAFRTADGFGASGIYLTGYTPAPPHRDIHKTALGAENSIAWKHFPKTEDALKAATSAGFDIYAIEQAQGSVVLNAFVPEANAGIALVFGNEVSGVSDTVLAAAKGCIEIPQFGAKHSLNISVCIGVVLWELVRR